MPSTEPKVNIVSNDSKADRIKSVGLFAKCDDKAIDSLMSIIDTADIVAGTELFQQGRRDHYAYVIESGTAEVLIDDKVIAEIPAGEMVGEVGLLSPGPASATVRAKTAMSVLAIPHKQFDAVLEDTPGLALAMARELAERLHAMDQRLP